MHSGSTLILRSAPMERVKAALSAAAARFADGPIELLVQEGLEREASALAPGTRVHTHPGAWFTEFNTNLGLLRGYRRIVLVYNSSDLSEYENLHRIVFLSRVEEAFGFLPSGGFRRLEFRKDGSLKRGGAESARAVLGAARGTVETALVGALLALLAVGYPLYRHRGKRVSETVRAGLRKVRVLYFQLADEIAKNTRDGAAREFDCRYAQTVWDLLKQLGGCDVLYLNPARRNHLVDLLAVHVAFFLGTLRGKYITGFLANEYVDLTANPVARSFFFVLNYLSFRQFDYAYVLPSRTHMARRYRLGEDRVGFIENFPPAPKPLPEPPSPWALIPKDRLLFLYHGNVLWYHGFLKFVKVFEALRRVRPEAMLLVVGPLKATPFNMLFSNERKILRQIAKLRSRPGAETGILFTGRWLPKSIVVQLARRSVFHVSQLDSESTIGDTELRTCLLEAMQWGMACLHCDSSAIRAHRCFEDGKNIVLIDPDDVAGSLRKILHYLDNPVLLDRIGESARETVQREFSFERWVDDEFTPRLRRMTGAPAEPAGSFQVGRAASRLLRPRRGTKPKALVIASCRMRQLERIRGSFKGWDLTCLIQRERLGGIEARGWTRCLEVRGEKFSVWNTGFPNILRLRKRRFDAVVVPWSNGDGRDYSNVELLALGVAPRVIVACTASGEIRLLHGRGILAKALRERLSRLGSALVEKMMFLFVSTLYRVGFRFRKKAAAESIRLKKAA